MLIASDVPAGVSLAEAIRFDIHQPALLLKMKRLKNAVETLLEAAAMPRTGSGGKRSGATAMELLLVTPVLLIFLMAIVQFGVILANLKYLPLASRAGAKVLAQTPSTDLTLPNVTTFPNVKAAIQAVLATGNMSSCRVVIEQNVVTGTMQQDPDTPCPCDAPLTPTLPANAVRVTVCVPWSELARNLNFLSFICFSLDNRTSQSSTLYPFEGPP